MKTAMKKLLSLALVVMLLVSAVPLAASAAGNENHATLLLQDEAGNSLGSVTASFKNQTATIGDLLRYEGKLDGSLDVPGYTRTSPDSTVVTANAQVTVLYKKDPVPVDPITMDILLDDSQSVYRTVSKEPANGTSATIGNLLNYLVSGWSDTYEFVQAYNSRLGTTQNLSAEVLAGENIRVRLKTKVVAVDPISIVVKVNDSDNVVWTGSKEPANGSYATVQNLLNYCWNSSWDDVYTFSHAWSSAQQANIALGGYIYAGDTVYIMLETSGSTNSGSGNSGSTNSGTSNKFPYRVYLHIYINNKVDEPDRNVNITSGIALDGRVTLAEVQNVVKNYYSASTDDGIKYDGLYLAEGNWVANFVYDLAKYTTIEDTNDMRQQREVHINVMVTNVVAKSSSSSSSTADSSNPKTGDTIYMAVTVLSLSAAALAAVYFVSKKRAIR